MYIYAMIGYEDKIVQYFHEMENLNQDMEDDPCAIRVDAVNEDWIQRKKYDAATQTFVDVSLSETATHNSLEFTHKDANGTKHWLDVFINNHEHSASDITSGVLPISFGGTGSSVYKQDVTLNIGEHANGESAVFGYDCQYIPYLNMCFLRVYAQPNQTLSADTAYEIATIADTQYLPANMMALSNYCQKEVTTYVNTDGTIVVRPYEDVGTSYGIRIAGFWFCD